MSRGVEVAGFEPAAFWSRTKDFARFSGSGRLLPGNAVNFLFSPAFFAEFPVVPVSSDWFHTGHLVFSSPL